LGKKGPEPSLFIKRGTEVSLSSPAFTGILTAVLEKGSSFRFLAKGFSMAPFIRDGDVITLAPVRDRPPGIGSVVAFFHPQFEKIMVHRVVGKKDGAYLIRGDNSPASDGDISRDHVLGFVTRVERREKNISLGSGFEKYLIAFLSRRGLLIPLLIPLLKIFRAFVPSGTRGQGEQRDEKKNNGVL
jgi:signal peptidase I